MRPRVAAWSALAVAAFAIFPATVVQAQDTDDPDADRWDRSTFELAEGKQALESDSDLVEVAGVFVYEKEFAVDTIESATIRVEPDPEADPPIPVECSLPDPVELEGIPRDQGAENSELEFAVRLILPCNGPYIVTASASASNAHAHEMVVPLGVSAPPGPVTELKTTPGPKAAVAVSWKPPQPTPRDIVGYIVERAGPASTTDFANVSGAVTVLEFQDTTVSTNGTYTYRVRAIRRAAVGTIMGSPNRAATNTAKVTTAPTTTTTTTAPRFSQGSAPIPTVPAPRPTPSLPSPPTTGDPGFDDTIDYGEGGQFELPSTATLPDSDEFAGGSIVNEDGATDAKQIWIPAAGASVLVVWAAHFFYINRLASTLDLDEVTVVEQA